MPRRLYRISDGVYQRFPDGQRGQTRPMDEKASGTRGRTAFGARMFQARRRRGLTQPQVAKALKIAQSTLSDAEHVALGSTLVTEFAALYCCNATWLATGEGDPDWDSVRESTGKFTSPGTQGVAHPTNLQLLTLAPEMSWEALMSSELPQVFWIELRDDALAPERPRGTKVEVTRGLAPEPGDGILIKDNLNNWYLRIYRERRAGEWFAAAVNRDYDQLSPELHAIEVVGVVSDTRLGRRWRAGG